MAEFCVNCGAPADGGGLCAECAAAPEAEVETEAAVPNGEQGDRRGDRQSPASTEETSAAEAADDCGTSSGASRRLPLEGKDDEAAEGGEDNAEDGEDNPSVACGDSSPCAGEPETEPEPGGNWVLIALAALLIAGAVIAALFITGVFGGKAVAPGSSGSESGASGGVPDSSDIIPSSSSDEQSDAPSSSAGSEFEGTPDFVARGMDIYLMQPLEIYSYMTDDLYEAGNSVTGTLRVKEYSKGELSEAALAFAEEKEVDLTGYETRRVVFEIDFESASPDIGYVVSDYYRSEPFEDSFDGIGYSADGEWEYSGAQVEIDGTVETIFILLSIDSGEEDDSYDGTDVWEILVPEGYDGVCCGYYNTMLDQSEQYQNGEYCYQFFDKDNMFFFRCA